MSNVQAAIVGVGNAPLRFRRQAIWFGILLLVALCLALRTTWPWLLIHPKDWILPASETINGILNWLVPLMLPICTAVTWALGAAPDACSLALGDWMAFQVDPKQPRR